MIKQYVVDAFADRLFEGNPAAVCIGENWQDRQLMQQIAKENNLSETAFVSRKNGHYSLRWFTPGGEIDLCGHATLAAAYVLMNFSADNSDAVHFETKSGVLSVCRKNNLYELDFPAFLLKPVDVTDLMADAVGFRPLEAWMGRDLVCVMENEDQIRGAVANLEKIRQLPGALLHITAPGSEYDCYSRSFAPKLGVAEDPVCGSGHCHIAPLWAEKLGKKDIKARQASERGGTLYCSVAGDRVGLAGNAVLFSIGELQIG